MASESSVMAVIRASRPSFRNAHDKVAFAVHASLVAAGYLLTATGPPAFSETSLSSPSNDEVGIDNWNGTDDCYAFVYTNPEKGSKKVLVKCLVMGAKLLIDALKESDEEPLHLEIDAGDYDGGDGTNNYAAKYKNFGKLVGILNKELLSKMDGPATGMSSSAPNPLSSGRGERLDVDLNIHGPRIAEPQGTESFTSGIVYPPVPPPGGSDIFPGPGAGMHPIRGDPGFGGSMLIGPNDPRWYGGGIYGDPRFLGGGPGVPPGARFDPYGPPGVPGFDPNVFVRGPRRPGSRTHPDLEPFRDGSDF